MPKFMGYRKNNDQREIYSCKHLHFKKKKYIKSIT